MRGGEGGGKTSQVKTQGHQLPSDGPDHSTSPKGHYSVEFQAGYTQLARSTGANVSVMVLQGFKSTPQKSRLIESGHGRHAVQVANVCGYKLGQQNEFQFWCELGWFLHGQSHYMPA